MVTASAMVNGSTRGTRSWLPRPGRVAVQTIGRGRDYDDVAPFRGVFAGASEHQLEVSVAMRRLSVEPLDAPAGVSVARQRAAQQQ